MGKKLGSFTRVSSAVRTAVEDAIVRILTPKRSIDVLREAQAARSRSDIAMLVHKTFMGFASALQPATS